MVAPMSRKPDDPRAISAWSRYRKMLNLSALARELGISPVSVFNWRMVPDTRVEAVSRAVGIPVQQLRPDLRKRQADLLPWELN